MRALLVTALFIFSMLVTGCTSNNDAPFQTREADEAWSPPALECPAADTAQAQGPALRILTKSTQMYQGQQTCFIISFLNGNTSIYLPSSNETQWKGQPMITFSLWTIRARDGQRAEEGKIYMPPDKIGGIVLQNRTIELHPGTFIVSNRSWLTNRDPGEYQMGVELVNSRFMNGTQFMILARPDRQAAEPSIRLPGTA